MNAQASYSIKWCHAKEISAVRKLREGGSKSPWRKKETLGGGKRIGAGRGNARARGRRVGEGRVRYPWSKREKKSFKREG